METRALPLTVYEIKKSVVLGWRALRPPRVVFVIGVASLINSLTSGKRHASATKEAAALQRLTTCHSRLS